MNPALSAGVRDTQLFEQAGIHLTLTFLMNLSTVGYVDNRQSFSFLVSPFSDRERN
jgi:hypothetical protein